MISAYFKHNVSISILPVVVFLFIINTTLGILLYKATDTVMYGSLLCQEMLYRSPGGLREPSHSHHVGPDGGQHLQAAGL